MTEKSFGERICGATVQEIIALEANYPPATAFASIDELLSRTVRASIDGRRIALLREAVKPYEVAELHAIDDGAEADFIVRTLRLSVQQSRGAWFLPAEATVRIGWANWPYHSDHYERFASGVAHRETGKIRFEASPAGLLIWSAIEPLFDLLYRPFALRGPTPLGGSRDEQRQVWEDVYRSYVALGIELDAGLCGMAFGTGWSKLRAPEQLSARRALRTAIGRAVPPDIGARYRVWVTRELVAKYYAKASRGAPIMRKVLTKPLQRSFSAFFGGDWLAFLEYLGEAPSPNERISTALPEPRLYVDAAIRAKEVAAEHGVPADEVERMLAAFWSSSIAESPVHRRVALLRSYWDYFDAAHAGQASGMNSLWGFADAEAVQLTGLDNAESGPAWYHPGQYRAKLPAKLLTDIASLWDGTLLPLAPNKTVTSNSPFNGMLDAFGPALRFWHGVGLTTWFLSEGPMSRTDMAGLERYHERDLEALASLGTPVDSALFTELIAAEKHLGKPKPYTVRETERDVGGHVQISTSMIIGSRRAGFERLRDIVTAYRRAWSAKYFDAYLRARWESEMREVAREFARHIEVKGKPPTAKQFAKLAEAPTNHWFGGDVNSLYAAIGERAPSPTERVRLLAGDPASFALGVFHALGGKKTEASNFTFDEDEAERTRRQAEWDAHWKRKQLAEESIRYVQLREAFGRQPTVVEFGRDKFEYLGTALRDDRSEAWETYAAAIDGCLGLANMPNVTFTPN